MILVVDDNDEIATLLTTFLGSQGFETSRARDGAECLQMAAKLGPDLIILDITMPKMDGFGVLSQLKLDRANRSIPVVMCTDHSMLNDVEKCCREGAEGYILKPFELKRVLDKVRSVIEKA